MARWNQKLVLVGIGAALLVGASGCVVETTGLYGLYEGPCVDEFDCADLDAVCLEDAATGDTFCTIPCSTSCPSPGVCVATTEGGFCLLGSGPIPPPLPPPLPPPPPGPLPFYATGCDGGANPCVSSAQCLELTNAADGSTDTFCSAGCTLDSDCGSNGWCLLQDASTSICFEACSSTADCDSAFGWMCEQVEDFETKDLVPACIPSWT